MNEGHQQVCSSVEWRAAVRDEVMPWVLTGVELGDDVVELGPGYGATTDVLHELVPRLTSVEIDPELAGQLTERFAALAHVEIVTGDATALTFTDGRFSGAATFAMLHHVPSPELQDRVFAEARRVLRPGGVFVATDSLAGDELRDFHEGDTYQPVDPATLPDRLAAAGFTDVRIETNEHAWKATAHRP